MPSVFILDDDPSNVKLIHMLLEMEGYIVQSFTSVKAAQTAAAQHTVSAFIVDYYLGPTANGAEVARAIRNNQFGQNNAAVIIITSGDHRRAQEAAAGGADAFIGKPFTPTRLIQELRQQLAGKE